MTLFDRSEPFARHMVELYGEKGEEWLRALPGLLQQLAERWSLTLLPPFPELSYNYAAPALRHGANGSGEEVVLKVGVPNRELTTEIAALNQYGGRGCVRLLEADQELGAMLLERLQPGTMLTSIEDDEEATRISAEVMLQLWRPAPCCHAFPTVADWAAGLKKLRPFFGGTGPFPPRLLEMAESFFADLLSTTAEPVLLHGDLHHYNILRAQRAPWLAIDPKGLVGDPGFEVYALMHNPAGLSQHSNLTALYARRLAILSEALGQDRQRLLRWSLAGMILSAWWSYEDGDEGQEQLLYAEHLAALL